MILDKIMNFIQSTGYFGLVILLFLESNPVIGSFIPGQVILFIAGFFVSIGVLDFYLVFLLSFLAAFSGDLLNYFVSYKYGNVLVSKYDMDQTKIYKNAVHFFNRNHRVGLIFGKFFNLTRAFTPTIAGKCKIKRTNFIFYSIISNVSWVFLSLFLGYKFSEFLLDNYDIIFKFIITLMAIITAVFISLNSMKLFYKQNYKLFRKYTLLSYLNIVLFIIAIKLVNLIEYNITPNIRVFFYIKEMLMIALIVILAILVAMKRKRLVYFFVTTSIFYVFFNIMLLLFFSKNGLLMLYPYIMIIQYIIFYLYLFFKSYFGKKRAFVLLVGFNFVVILTFYMANYHFGRILISIMSTAIFLELVAVLSNYEIFKDKILDSKNRD